MIIVDRLAGHRDSTVHQENPLIDQSIWENCRPSQRGVVKDTVRGGGGSSSGGGVGSTRNLELVWNDTYALVCNDGMNIISGEAKKVVNVPSQKLTDLQKLCIVRLMHNGQEQFKENHHRDYIFAPTHSLHSELCMIIQTRYFFLPDVSFTIADEILRENVVKEISVDEYAELIQVVEPKVIVAHEIAFAPKGDHFANVSIWFDASPVQLEQSQIKRSRRLKQKKKAQIRNEHTHPNANGALISRTSSADFPYVIDGIEPFVSMSPANDSDETHGLVMSILEHRIDSIIIENCTSVGDHQKKRLVLRKRQLMEKFIFMNRFHEDWTWPKREGMGNVTISTKAPPGNIMPYIPLKSSKTSPCVPVWNSFVKNIGAEDDVSDVDDSKRLSIFRLLGSGIPLTNDAHPLPHILSNSNDESTPTSNSETWKEILLGVPEGGKWEAVIRVMKNKRGEESPVNIVSNGRNMPLSTIPFVQV